MRKIKFLFIAPPYEILKGLNIESIPLGLLYLATVLDLAGFKAWVYDGDSSFQQGRMVYSNSNRAISHSDYVTNLNNEAHPAWQKLHRILNEYKPDFVGISMMTPLFSSIKKVIEIVKELLPQAQILGGGPHITILKEKAFESLPQIDVGFIGEAEESIVEFAHKTALGEDLSCIKGLLLRKNSKIIFTGIRDRIDDLNNLPFPNRKLLIDESKYKKHILGMMIASRGCPFQCAFCASVPLWNRKVRMRSPENIVQEIDYLVENYNISSFGFWDDTFTINKKVVIKFCKLIYKKYGPRRFKWNCLSNINRLDKQILFWLKKAGCKTIAIGVESGSDRILKLIKKGITKDQVRHAVRLIREHGFWLHTFFMVGIPYETEDDIKKTIGFIRELQPDSLNLCTFTPHPGTELYNYVVNKGMFKDHENYQVYDNIGHHSINNFFLENITAHRYQDLLKKLLKLSTEVSKKLNFRKLWLLSKRITLDKVKYKLKNIFT